jgi:hypothetical protein
MQGRRRDDNHPTHTLEVGDYSKQTWTGQTTWAFRDPDGHIGQLCPGHQVTEHDDGTITVSPSIACDNGISKWHGFLERGVWREC